MSRAYKKLFSILGDSISTLFGYSEPMDASYYVDMMKHVANVHVPADTWWGMVIERLDGELLVNNSIYGSTVIKHQSCEVPSYGCSKERTSALDRAGQKPDVIMIFLGMNDWGYGINPADSSDTGADLSVFNVAYFKMVDRLKRNYPRAEIWCITPFVGICREKSDLEVRYSHGGHHIEEYCEVIRLCAEKCGGVLIDLYNHPIKIDTVDGYHPNKEGMKVIADCVISSCAQN